MEWFRLKPKQGVTVPHKLTGRRKRQEMRKSGQKKLNAKCAKPNGMRKRPSEKQDDNSTDQHLSTPFKKLEVLFPAYTG